MHPADCDLTAPEVVAHPEELFAAMRRSCPVFYSEQMDTYMLARYDDVREAMRLPIEFSSDRPFFGTGDAELEAIQAEGYPQVPTLTMTDPPIHTRYRKLVNQAFSPKAVRELEPSIRRIVNEIIDVFAAGGEVEFVREFAGLVPGYVIADALGLPRADQDRFMEWADNFVDSIQGREILSRERQLECQRSFIEFQRYFAGVIEQRRRQPGSDLISSLVTARVAGERPLEMEEILDLIRIFLTAGNETTASWLSGTMLLLLTHPDQFAEVRADRSLIPVMLEESVRLVSPARWTRRTLTGEPFEMSGVTIPPGATVRPLWTSANRDEAYFPHPDEFDIRRDNSAHMAFGHGVHFCLGVNLARAEARVAFEVLLDRLADITLAIPADEVRNLPVVGVNRLAALPLRFTAAA
ncbi:cytochrome P450 [Acrocarpospora catenulata]|uniref:cytochrome P450 n=1 Tax=Acrocarpospora catenulata TaxID=2836182 RepID=UPI001BDB60B4|nr:cytochrome P450 [Acrocarpospora catenulata]